MGYIKTITARIVPILLFFGILEVIINLYIA